MAANLSTAERRVLGAATAEAVAKMHDLRVVESLGEMLADSSIAVLDVAVPPQDQPAEQKN